MPRSSSSRRRSTPRQRTRHTPARPHATRPSAARPANRRRPAHAPQRPYLDETLAADATSPATSEAAAQPAHDKRILNPQPESPKLHKVLAQAGHGARLEIEALIAQGHVRVNGQPAHVGQRVQYGDSITLHGRPVRVRIAPPLPRVIAYHKPVGELVTHNDPQNRPTVFRTLPRLHQGKWQTVGRLDINTEGLLLITSSGELANQLMHPRFGLQREYAVRVLGALDEQHRRQLLDGVQLDDGPARFGSIQAEGGGEGVNQWYRVTISEGRNREVRRMFEAVGHAVSRLIRVRYGMLSLPRGLRRGAWTELGEREVQALMQAAGMQESHRLTRIRMQEQQQRPQRFSPDRGVSGKKRKSDRHTGRIPPTAYSAQRDRHTSLDTTQPHTPGRQRRHDTPPHTAHPTHRTPHTTRADKTSRPSRPSGPSRAATDRTSGRTSSHAFGSRQDRAPRPPARAARTGHAPRPASRRHTHRKG